MGEILRGILDDRALSAETAFYTLPVVTVCPTGGDLFGIRSAVLQTKIDTSFLMMGLSVFGQYRTAAASYAADSSTIPNDIAIRDMSSGLRLDNLPTLRANTSGGLQAYMTLPEYYLWGPNAMIGVDMNVLIQTAAGNIRTYTTFAVLVGIEYKFPNGDPFGAK